MIDQKSEVFGINELKQLAESLARNQEIYNGRSKNLLIKLLKAEKNLLLIQQKTSAFAVKKHVVSAPGTWLLDNFHLIDENTRILKRDFPSGYSKNLPCLKNGVYSGFPRLYELIVEYVYRSDATIDENYLSQYIAKYQQSNELTIGELWAIPIILRLTLIENINRIAKVIDQIVDDNQLAHSWFEKIATCVDQHPQNLLTLYKVLFSEVPIMKSSFVNELSRLLHENYPTTSFPITWFERKLADSSTSLEQHLENEKQKQAICQISIANSITGLRIIEKIDWKKFVETQSIINSILLKDPANIYGKMDFFSRDLYRHRIESISRAYKLKESFIATQILKLAEQSCEQNNKNVHIGNYLFPNFHEYDAFLNFIGIKNKTHSLWSWTIKKHALLLYLITIFTIILFLSDSALQNLQRIELNPIMTITISILLFLSLFESAISIANLVFTKAIHPTELPKMDFKNGIPNYAKTIVTIPTIATSVNNAIDLVHKLETQFLANQEQNLHFVLLVDFADADQETTETDKLIQQTLQNRMTELNHKYYPSTKRWPFYLLMRPRQWNQMQQKWMAWERKRGKLHELNQLILGKSHSFNVIVGNHLSLLDCKYVITLDTDTKLQRDDARRLIGAMEHPHVRPIMEGNKVISGYGILQPNVAITMESSQYSHYSKMFTDEPGVDPYTGLCSDLYQDMFQAGSFIGKGIYHVEIFDKALAQRFPENRILSHDLIEGCYANTAVISNVVLYEEHPSQYLSDVLRRQRWVRGDWQIASWIGFKVPNSINKKESSTLNALSRWKIIDNLRRSLNPIAYLALIFFTVINYDSLQFLIPFLLLIAFSSTIYPTINLFTIPNRDLSKKLYYKKQLSRLKTNVLQNIFKFSVLPFEAFINTDAILRTLYRTYISKKNLLEWNAAQNVERSFKNCIVSHYKKMCGNIFASILLFFISFDQQNYLGYCIVFIWLLGPALAFSLSKPIINRPEMCTENETNTLKLLARRTWGFFDDFVNKENNFLPIDNHQIYPRPKSAPRTSPTNIGLYLISIFGAYKFGYITTNELMNRLQLSFDTLNRMPKYKGHLYNWYDTQNLAILPPFYVSTVDSGNFIASLWALEHSLNTLLSDRIMPSALLEGLCDTIHVAYEDQTINHQHETASLKLLQFYLIDIYDSTKALTEENIQLFILYDSLSNIKIKVDTLLLNSDLQTIIIKNYIAKIASQITDIFNHIDTFLPWVSILQKNRHENFYSEVCDIFLKNYQNNFVLKDFFSKKNTTNLINHLEIYQKQNPNNTTFNTCFDLLLQSLNVGQNNYEHFNSKLNLIKLSIKSLMDADFSFLYDEKIKLLTIGFNTERCRRDDGFYDLLASEARLTSFVGIVLGKLPTEHWFALGRSITTHNKRSALLSWSGSAFEYLMPPLLLPSYDKTLLHETCISVVDAQIQYGRLRQTPWGISESGYNITDGDLNYQYKAFGVPGLGYKRGLSEDLVIAPYASVMSLMYAPQQAAKNIEKLISLGIYGKYGLYEALDYTPSRVPKDKNFALVQSYMAHHQGMAFLALLFTLKDKPIQKILEQTSEFTASKLLLQEKNPISEPYMPHQSEIQYMDYYINHTLSPYRIFHKCNSFNPVMQLLSNGKMHSVSTNSGAGYLAWNQIQVTRRRDDSIIEETGIFAYVQDSLSNQTWSTTFAPKTDTTPTYEVIFSENLAEFRCKNKQLEVYQKVAVAPEDDVEIREFHVINSSSHARKIKLTFYSEMCLNTYAGDLAHPAFGKLFIETSADEQNFLIKGVKRPRQATEASTMMYQKINTYNDSTISNFTFETDRSAFIGRRRDLRDPIAISENHHLTKKLGSVIDPIIAMQIEIDLKPESSVTFDFITGIANETKKFEELISKYSERKFVSRAFELSWTYGQLLLRQLSITASHGQLFCNLAGHIRYPDRRFRCHPDIAELNKKDRTGLWGYSISGDLPIVLVKISDDNQFPLLQDLILAHTYLSYKGFDFDIILWNNEDTGYRQNLMSQINDLIQANSRILNSKSKGRIFPLSSNLVPEEDQILMQAFASVIIDHNIRDINDLLKRSLSRLEKNADDNQFTTNNIKKLLAREEQTFSETLSFFNGFGGFSQDGKEYVLLTNKTTPPPAPWVNVIANKHFGSIITESGAAYSWAGNAHEYRLSPWNNDPTCDFKGEFLYIKDVDSSEIWSPTPLPCPSNNDYIVRHGFGYTTYIHEYNHIATELSVFVPDDIPAKIIILTIKNNSDHVRNLRVTSYIEWALGEHLNPMQIVTKFHHDLGYITAQNINTSEFKNNIAYCYMSQNDVDYTCNKKSFIGKHHSVAHPIGVKQQELGKQTGIGFESCGALASHVCIDPHANISIAIVIGAEQSIESITQRVSEFKDIEFIKTKFLETKSIWLHRVSKIQIATPDQTFNILTNGWLVYQTLVSRIYAKSGFYQSGGAFGFRDQLQDAVSLAYVDTDLLKNQILMCAGRQFKEGDVMHWWHPPGNKGVRTHFSDDFLWLPWAVSRYIEVSQDYSILDLNVKFLDGPRVPEHQEAIYDYFNESSEEGSIYEHCLRSIKNSLKFGIHGFPLMGCGDWNDGMNMVGEKGKGESVWLAFFLYDIVSKFAPLSHYKKDFDFEKNCNAIKTQMKQAIETNAWDGNWYLRAFYDSGNAMGSAQNDECKIDSLPQSWAVISGAGEEKRVKIALANAERYLVKREKGLIQLFDPPFDKSAENPGYIKGYVPGVRENGGQYTHAATWLAMAFAKFGDYNRAYELASILNPINHSSNNEDAQVYKVEPYVMVADIYSVAANLGRGGWTWYTGSSGWYYRLIIESILGIHLKGDRLYWDPKIPDHWSGFTITLKYFESTYEIKLMRREAGKNPQVTIDSQLLEVEHIHLNNDGLHHIVEIKWPRGYSKNWSEKVEKQLARCC